MGFNWAFKALMYELKKKNLERYLGVNLLRLGPRLIKKNLRDRGLTKVEKYSCRYTSVFMATPRKISFKARHLTWWYI